LRRGVAESSTYDATRPGGLLGRCTDCGAIVAAGQTVCKDGVCADADERRHRKLLRMLGHVKDALRIDPLILYRAAALAGYNANPKPSIHKANSGQKALWAEEDADALMAVGSEEEV
jgi:hypothetical protein